MRKLFSRIIILLVALVCISNVQAAPKASNDAIWKNDITERNFIKKVKKFHVPDGIGKKGYDKYFKNNARMFYRISIRHKIDPKYVFALGIVESCWGEKLVALNNLFGLGSYTQYPESIAYVYKSPTAAIKDICCILEEYRTPSTWQYEAICAQGYNPKTIEGQLYLYSANPTEAEMVKAIIRQVFGKKRKTCHCCCCGK